MQTTQRTNLGRAKLIKRRESTFPFRMGLYLDCTPWGGGYLHVGTVGHRWGTGPGVVLVGDVLVNLQTGAVTSSEGV